VHRALEDVSEMARQSWVKPRRLANSSFCRQNQSGRSLLKFHIAENIKCQYRPGVTSTRETLSIARNTMTSSFAPLALLCERIVGRRFNFFATANSRPVHDQRNNARRQILMFQPCTASSCDARLDVSTVHMVHTVCLPLASQERRTAIVRDISHLSMHLRFW
jgi:hypothetical protein